MEEKESVIETTLDTMAKILKTALIILITIYIIGTNGIQIELEEKYIEETIRLQEEQIEILEKIENKIY